MNTAKSKVRFAGFTLLEVLAVIAVIGIMAAVLVPLSIRSYRVQQLQGAASVVFSELVRARNTAQRSSKDQTLTWTATSLTTTPSGGAARTVSLSDGMTFATPNSTGVRYLAPYGELVALGASGWRLEMLSPAGLHTAVDLVGVMGKPIRRAVVNIGVALEP